MKRFIAIISCLFVYVHISAQEVLGIPSKNRNTNDSAVFFPTTLYKVPLVSEKEIFRCSFYHNSSNKLRPILNSELINLSIAQNYRSRNLFISNDEHIMPELLKKQSVEVGFVYDYDKLLISVGLIANVYNFNPLSAMHGSTIQKQFGVNGWLTYDFNRNVSASVYGRYVTNSFFYSMASFPYIEASSFGGFITLHNEKCGIDLGVNSYYDAFNRCWQTNPIVRPTYKIGKVKINIDLGPLIKEGILRLMKKHRADGPIIMPSMWRRE